VTIHEFGKENEQYIAMRKGVLGKYPNLVHAGLVLLKSELFVGKIRRL